MKTLKESILGSMGMGDKKIYSDSFAIHAVKYFLDFYKDNEIDVKKVTAYEGYTSRGHEPYLFFDIFFPKNIEPSIVSATETKNIWLAFINKESQEAKKRTEITSDFKGQFTVSLKVEEYVSKSYGEKFSCSRNKDDDFIQFVIPFSEWIKYRSIIKSYVKKLGFKYEEDKVK